MRCLITWATLFAACAGLALAAKQPIVESDLLKIAKVTEVKVTPDNAFAIYGVLSIVTLPAVAPATEPTYSYRTHLWMADLRDPARKPVQLTFGDRSDSGIAISPDSAMLAFVRPDDKKSKPQIWLLALHGPGEAQAITSLEFGAASPRWRGDSKAILFTSPIPISKLPGKPGFSEERPELDWAHASDPKATGSPDGDLASIRLWLDHNAGHSDPADLTRMNFLGELSLQSELSFSEVFEVEVGAGEKANQITKSFRNHAGAIYSPKGNEILFAADPDGTRHPDRADGKSAIYSMKADGTNEHVLIHPDGYNAAQPQFTHDGRIVFLAQQEDQASYRQSMLGIADADGAHSRWLSKDGEPGVVEFEIAEDDSIYYSSNVHGGQPLLHVDPNGAGADTVIAPPAGINAFAMTKDKLVYAEIAAGNPNELYVASHTNAERRRVTDLNTGWLADKIISLPEEHWITRPDGLRVQYWVMKPTNTDASTKYPWVLDIHGGPSAMWGPGEFSMWHEFQIFCSFGYGVVYGNPRGSSGYGYAFQRANFKDWGEGPMADVMATVEDAESHYPMIDKDRLFVTGGSYAGYLTAWIVGHSKVFKAAAAERGVYDLATFFGEGNAYRLVPEEFGGFPWEPATRKMLDEESPITYAVNITTPLLIIHGSQDNRTGVVQGQMLFRTLKQLNRPVEYIRYPGAGHELTRSGPPQQRMDHMLRIIEFFERYAHNTRTPPHETTE